MALCVSCITNRNRTFCCRISIRTYSNSMLSRSTCSYTSGQGMRTGCTIVIVVTISSTTAFYAVIMRSRSTHLIL
ncbi:Uncharacterised protein [Eikenella corrodens]|uniref:Uncharacterized protein n=1 Tax=Eikenella corrodens TaxID=539 RepID=A0A8B4GMK5_EIKCO|nr:Uncharacterised protein [Eikenella corrodens]